MVTFQKHHFVAAHGYSAVLPMPYASPPEHVERVKVLPRHSVIGA